MTLFEISIFKKGHTVLTYDVNIFMLIEQISDYLYIDLSRLIRSLTGRSGDVEVKFRPTPTLK